MGPSGQVWIEQSFWAWKLRPTWGARASGGEPWKLTEESELRQASHPGLLWLLTKGMNCRVQNRVQILLSH